MYTESDITHLVEVFRQHEVAEIKLLVFLEPIAHALGFNDIVSVSVNDTDVHFDAEWNGPYQSHDVSRFTFPVTMLTESVDKIVNHLRKRDEK